MNLPARLTFEVHDGLRKEVNKILPPLLPDKQRGAVRQLELKVAATYHWALGYFLWSCMLLHLDNHQRELVTLH